MSDPSICIAGAGSIGCYVGGMLRAGGRPVSLLARPRVIDDVRANGLKVTSFNGIEHQLMRTIWVVSAVIRKAMEAATVRIHPSRDGARRSVSCSEADMAFKVKEMESGCCTASVQEAGRPHGPS